MSRTYRNLHKGTRYGHKYLKQFPHWRSRAQASLAVIDALRDEGFTIRPRYGRDLVAPEYYDDILLSSETLKQRRRTEGLIDIQGRIKCQKDN